MSSGRLRGSAVDAYYALSRVIGSPLWVANGTRPDISYAVGSLAKYTSNPGRVNWEALLRVLGYLSHTLNHCIWYRRDTSSEDGVPVIGYARGILPQLSDFQCYVDASFAGDVDTYWLHIQDLWWTSIMAESDATLCGTIQYGV